MGRRPAGESPRMQATIAGGIFMWSAWQPDRNLFFNSFFVEAEGGNLVIDPLALSEADATEIEGRGGIAWIVVTNRDHKRATASLAERFGAKVAASALDAPALGIPVARTLEAGDEIGGARVIGLDGLKTPGEIALHFRKQRAVVVGDAFWGDPAGSVRMMPDEKLGDPAGAALSLRRIAAARPDHLLVGDGACVFGGATATIWACLEARTDVYVNRINLDEAPWTRGTPGNPRPYADARSWTDIDFLIGAERLGYRVARIEPGDAFCPLHWHTAEEELFVILDGEVTLLTPRGNWPLRKGDFIAFPTRMSGAHKIVNESGAPCEILMVSNVDLDDVCSYPDSHKVLIESTDLMLRDYPVLDYFDGE